MTINGINECKDCSIGCLKCNAPGVQGSCGECDPASANPYWQLQGSLYVCKPNCHQGFYPSLDGNWTACSTGCLTCTSSECSEAAQGYVLDPSTTPSTLWSLATLSLTGKFIDVLLGLQNCDANCINCMDISTWCISCAADKYLDPFTFTCVANSNCPAGTYAKLKTSTMTTNLCEWCQNNKKFCNVLTGLVDSNVVDITCTDSNCLTCPST